MQTRAERAVGRFHSEWNCAQSVLWAFHDELGLAPDLASRIATGFGAGMARRQEVCGALSGGIMVLGLRHGRGEGQGKQATEEAYAKVEELLLRFETLFGACSCRELVEGCDLATAEGRQAFKDRDLKNRVCTRCVAAVVEILERPAQRAPAAAPATA